MQWYVLSRRPLRVGEFPSTINESLITLIPKKENLETMSQFRPIALCNVTTKLITKIVANRLKPLMKKLTGLNQASFIPRKQATDNMVIVQEIIHSMKRKTGKKGAVAIKVDLEKAYDWDSWDFLEKILGAVGFEKKIVDLIMFCIKSTELSII